MGNVLNEVWPEPSLHHQTVEECILGQVLDACVSELVHEVVLFRFEMLLFSVFFLFYIIEN